ncbi:cupin domain-containing protein [Micromonospora sediminicola]|uniref:JmjC domain-containing protein n=1 Tax=Micromonospora sediminicola TaxID=946078 RepID=UPI0033F243A1
MSLRLLLPHHADELISTWPDEVKVFRDRQPTDFDEAVTSDFLLRYIRTGCLPVKEIAAVHDGPAITAEAFLTNGHVNGDRLLHLLDSGYTLRLGNIQRIFPYVTGLCRAIQQETGYSNYVHAFLTPPKEQGLNWHWDQQSALIYQVSGTKRWELWKPIIDGPVRNHLLSYEVWTPQVLQRCLDTGPDHVVDLNPGEMMWMPRGWIHNPFNVHDTDMSVHLTFAIRERTPFWVADEIVKDAIAQPHLRTVIRPETLLSEDQLAAVVTQTRADLIAHLQGLDAAQLATELSRRALRDLEFTT